MKTYFSLTFSLIVSLNLMAQQTTPTKDVLLLGTFHYNNPGADVAKTKTFDVMSNSAQQELEKITAKIKAYHPTQVFVEWPHDEQK